MCLGVTMNGEVLEKKKQSHEICLGVLRKINERISQRRVTAEVLNYVSEGDTESIQFELLPVGSHSYP